MKESLAYFNHWFSFYYEKKDLLIKDPFIQEKLELLKKAIEKSRQAFIEKGSFAFCSACANSGEKCCKAGLEWKLSPAEFLINLLLAETYSLPLAFNTSRKEDCLFLGEKGCSLILTPIFCRNFFCDKLVKHLGHANLTYIQQAMEEEATLGFIVANYITTKLLQKEGTKHGA
ncbi:MAG: Uncharacterized protein XD67_0622 [Thermodesulfobacterium commune]|uniref:Uncharacterized protein n=1 Tax=Thermodesulfobacterium commune TaxID=1741 RepID=A0A101FJD4_9BACT|nr:MAG: Uncharacterized protein XD67_0622 [Thermodesulfobacterium commune]HAA84393.1 hypothetical protein [Thermodesulfobacterium commune]